MSFDINVVAFLLPYIIAYILRNGSSSEHKMIQRRFKEVLEKKLELTSPHKTTHTKNNMLIQLFLSTLDQLKSWAEKPNEQTSTTATSRVRKDRTPRKDDKVRHLISLSLFQLY